MVAQDSAENEPNNSFCDVKAACAAWLVIVSREVSRCVIDSIHGHGVHVFAINMINKPGRKKDKLIKSLNLLPAEKLCSYYSEQKSVICVLSDDSLTDLC